MTTRSESVPILFLCLMLLAACSRDGTSPEGNSKARKYLSIGTAPPGGAFFIVGGALAEVLNAHGAEHKWEVTAESTKGSQENIRRLQSGELDFALSNAGITYFAVRGKEGWEQPYPMRAVMTLAANIAMFITRADSGIRSVPDLKGKRVVVGPAGAGFEFFVKPLLAAHDVTYEDFTPLNSTQAGAVDMLADGSAAAAFLGGAVPTASITQAATSQDIFFVPFSEEAMAEAMDRYPFFHPATIARGTYRGQQQDFHGLDVGSMHLITRAQLNDDLVYEVTRAIYENQDEVTAKHPAGRAINPENVVRDIGTEFHPGAVRYYQEIGIWPERPRASPQSR